MNKKQRIALTVMLSLAMGTLLATTVNILSLLDKPIPIVNILIVMTIFIVSTIFFTE